MFDFKKIILKSIAITKFIIFNIWFVLFVAVLNHQSWKTVLVTKLCLRQKKPKTPPKTEFLDKKQTWRPRFLECAERHVVKFPKNWV